MSNTMDLIKSKLMQAREECLLGDYEHGLPKFESALKLLHQSEAISTSLSSEVLTSLLTEYNTIKAYCRSLNKLKCINAQMLKRKSNDHPRTSISHNPTQVDATSNTQTATNCAIMKENLTTCTKKRGASNRSQDNSRSFKRPFSEIVNQNVANQHSNKIKYSELAKEQDWADLDLIESIERDIVDNGERITFDDIAGLEHTKELLQEAVMLPKLAPHLFTGGMLKPCSGILMFGPPGTGKTLLAKAVASACRSTFFNISASTLSSKYRGDSEKMVRILFDMARYYSPSIIFMDEIDAIASIRGISGEHEASRRVKTELLVQLNGISSDKQGNSEVILLAATNLPWELDDAMRRRLTKRVYIPLPDAKARYDLFRINLTKVQVSKDLDLDSLVCRTKGYSGDDIANLCETAKRMPVKRLYTPELLKRISLCEEIFRSDELLKLENDRLIVYPNDFDEALKNVSKSVGYEQLERFERWDKEFGSK